MKREVERDFYAAREAVRMCDKENHSKMFTFSQRSYHKLHIHSRAAYEMISNVLRALFLATYIFPLFVQGIGTSQGEERERKCMQANYFKFNTTLFAVDSSAKK